MLGRRQLRAKAMQALYAYYRGNEDQQAIEVNMMKGIQEVETLYFVLLDFTLAIRNEAVKKMEIGRKKNFPTPEELNPDRRFVDNPIFGFLEENETLVDFRAKHNEYNWEVESVYPASVWKEFSNSETYSNYMKIEEVDYNEHRKLMRKMYERYIAPNEDLTSFLEDRNLSWADDMHIANTMVVSTIKQCTEESGKETPLLKLVLDKNHLDFTKSLVRQTIRYEGELKKIIGEKANNWELDRIALIDRIILQMALAEFLHFPSIPPKVTINEYVEIAKSYSTPNSKVFVNGILDRTLKELTEKGEIRKSARGLIDK